MGYRVNCTWTQVFTSTGDGPRVVSLFLGDPVPADAPPQWIERQLAAGKITRT